MEEWVGEVWHNLITKKTNTAHNNAQVPLSSVVGELSVFYRALGGEQGKILTAGDHRALDIQLSTLQKIAGTHRKFSLCWQDDNCVSLPASINYFDSITLNENLYFWLTALAAHQPQASHWFRDNQAACLHLLSQRPGLNRYYQQLLPAVLALRPALSSLTGQVLARELAIRQALIYPGSVAQLPIAKGEPYPVILWQYPSPIHSVYLAPYDTHEPNADEDSATKPMEQCNIKKQAQRHDDKKATDGLLVFQLPSLFSWSEQVQLDRGEDDSDEEDISTVVEDMDIISVAQSRRSRAAKIKFDMDLPCAENDDLPIGEGIKLPEWHYKKKILVNDYCLLQAMLADRAEAVTLPEHLYSVSQSVKKRFSLLQPEKKWLKRQPYGDELDLDDWLNSQTDPEHSLDNDRCYSLRSRHHRDLSCLLLADLSLSTDAMLTDDKRVIDIIRDTLLVFADVLANTQDQFSIYGFSSLKNHLIRYHILKNFSEPYSDHARGRIAAIKPGYYTRMGAAIRQSTTLLAAQNSQQKLLLIISDGKPNDADQYETRYGIEDTKHAIVQAKRLGIKPFCITIDNQAQTYMPYLFGDSGFVVVNDVLKLPSVLPTLYFNLTA